MTVAVATGGTVAPGFEVVREVFDDNFARHGELGAAFAAYRDGELVADLWGGVADAATGAPWRRDTLGHVFSASKALTAVAVLALVDRGAVDLDAPVALYWPEFAAHGKGHVQVKDIMSHRARLPVFRAPVAHADLARPRALAALLAAQPREADPRARLTYHGLTYGTLAAELVRRVAGRSLGAVIADDVVAPLGEDMALWLGVPDAAQERVATLRYSPEHWGHAAGLDPDAVRHDPLAWGLWHNPPLFPPGAPRPWNDPALRAAEIPAAGAIGDARSMARLMGCLACGGAPVLSHATLLRGRRALARGHDAIVGIGAAYGVGFQLQTDRRHLGPPTGAFGHEGAGGSLHAAWPRERVGFSYIMNEMRDDPDGDGRAARLVAALHDAVSRRVPR